MPLGPSHEPSRRRARAGRSRSAPASPDRTRSDWAVVGTSRDLDYPFEFYTPDEVHDLLESVGLDTYGEILIDEFVGVAALRGDVSAWIREWQDGFRAERIGRRGFFAERGAGLDSTGAVETTVVNETDRWRPCEFTASIYRRAGAELVEHASVCGILYMPPRRSVAVRVTFDGHGRGLALDADGPHVAFPQRRADPPPEDGPLEAHLTVLPSGFPRTDRTARLFPRCCAVLSLGER